MRLLSPIRSFVSSNKEIDDVGGAPYKYSINNVNGLEENCERIIATDVVYANSSNAVTSGKDTTGLKEFERKGDNN